MNRHQLLAAIGIASAAAVFTLSSCSTSTPTSTATSANSVSSSSSASVSIPTTSTNASSGNPSSPTADAVNSPPSSPPVSSAAVSASAALKIGSTKLGVVMTNAKGMTVYYFTSDVPNSGKSNCYDKCATAWPPVTATSTAAAVGITGTLGSITRTDGTKQLTVNGRPVYTFAFDKAPGDANGQGSEKVWYAIHPSGGQIG